MSSPWRADITQTGRPSRKMISPVARMPQNALMKPASMSMVAPTASSTRKAAAPKAVLATRHSDHFRKLGGVKRSA